VPNAQTKPKSGLRNNTSKPISQYPPQNSPCERTQHQKPTTKLTEPIVHSLRYPKQSSRQPPAYASPETHPTKGDNTSEHDTRSGRTYQLSVTPPSQTPQKATLTSCASQQPQTCSTTETPKTSRSQPVISTKRASNDSLLVSGRAKPTTTSSTDSEQQQQGTKRGSKSGAKG
jgi:hypothetical protein